jgi:hypothetical protein
MVDVQVIVAETDAAKPETDTKWNDAEFFDEHDAYYRPRGPRRRQPLSALTEAGYMRLHRFQRQAVGYRRKLVSAANSFFPESCCKDFPYCWNK